MVLFMDSRMINRRKYVTVTAIHYVNGMCCPQVIETEAGAFLLEDIKKVQRLSVKSETGADERYVVIINGKEKDLYRKGDMWFIIPEKEDFDIFGLTSD